MNASATIKMDADGSGPCVYDGPVTDLPLDEWLQVAAVFPNCEVPDCEFKAHAGEAKCYCHSRGFNPPVSFEAYCNLDDAERVAYGEEIRRLEARV